MPDLPISDLSEIISNNENNYEAIEDLNGESNTVFIETHECVHEFFCFINIDHFLIVSSYLNFLIESDINNNIPNLHFFQGTRWFIPVSYLTSFVNFITNIGYSYILSECLCNDIYYDCDNVSAEV